MPNFKSDIAQEKILSKYLDTVYKDKKIDFKRISDIESQLQGIDLIISYKSNDYFIDEKAQLHYLNSDLPTFTFELSYFKDNSLKDGWLFDKNKLSHYYFLVTGITLKERNKELSTHNDIDRVKITSVNRNKLIQHLASIDLSHEKLMMYDFEVRNHDMEGQNHISELNPNTEGLIYYTKRLDEKPINLQLRLNYLLKTGVAKRFHYV